MGEAAAYHTKPQQIPINDSFSSMIDRPACRWTLEPRYIVFSANVLLAMMNLCAITMITRHSDCLHIPKVFLHYVMPAVCGIAAGMGLALIVTGCRDPIGSRRTAHAEPTPAIALASIVTVGESVDTPAA